MPRHLKTLCNILLILLCLPALANATSAHAATPTSVVDLSDGLVAHYSFDDGTATDESGNANHGRLVQTPTEVPGVIGNALKFGGIDHPSYVVVPNSPSLAFVDNFTISLWFNIQDNISMDGYGRRSEYGNQAFLGKPGDRSGLNLEATRAQDNIWYPWAQNGRCCGAASLAWYSPIGTVLDEWHMLSFSHGGGVAKLFLDGEVQYEGTSAAFNINPSMAVGDLYLGIINAGGMWYPLNGELDDVRIYNRTLDGTEIMALFQQVAQSVIGRVVDSSSGNAGADGKVIPGAAVSLLKPSGGTASTFTDASGVFTFTVTSTGTYTATVTKPMYTFSPALAQLGVPQNEHRLDFVGTLNPDFSPVIFVPAITGSYLVASGSNTELWPGQIWGTDHSLLSNRPNDRPNENEDAAIYAPDVIRVAVLNHAPDSHVYDSLLASLTENRTEYAVGGKPDRRTSKGCDLSQAKANPALFVFAYDWRLSNVGTAEQFADYIGCIRRFYPGVKVNIIAHSMGGLVARRYIIEHQTDHGVRKLISVGTPWLGAPDFLDTLENGGLGLQNLLLSPSEVRSLLEAFPGAHELLPSRAYFEYAQASGEENVFAEHGYDINGKDGAQQTYSYDDLIDFVNSRYPREDSCSGDIACRVGDNNKTFHDFVGQDKWVDGPNDIEYSYIVGVRRNKNTFAGFIARPVMNCYGEACALKDELVPTTTRGDGTVPLISARRAGIDNDPDGSKVRIFPIEHSPWLEDKDDSDTEHLGMTQNPDVQNLIRNILVGDVPTRMADIEQTLLPAEPAYYLRVSGSSVAYVTNGEGQITGAISPTLLLREAGEVSYFPSSTGNFLAIIPTTGNYTVTFASGNNPMHIELTREGELPPDYAVRWQNQILPPNSVIQLRLTPTGVEGLIYDSNGDGTPEAGLPPTVEVSGPAATDVTPPTITVSSVLQGNEVHVTISAIDDTAVERTYYSLDGKNFQEYTGSFLVNVIQSPFVSVFADDTLANRSSLSTWRVGYGLFLPAIVKPD